jgi:cell division protein FtsW (lipid II flippase)
MADLMDPPEETRANSAADETSTTKSRKSLESAVANAGTAIRRHGENCLKIEKSMFSFVIRHSMRFVWGLVCMALLSAAIASKMIPAPTWMAYVMGGICLLAVLPMLLVLMLEPANRR